MAKQSLAVKYRPKYFEDVIEQDTIKMILSQQIKDNDTKNAYLFCGSAGTGKTTCARIFANAINNYAGNPIEIDAASNSSVDDVREIIQQSKTRSMDSEYKVFIIDECHSLSNTAWQALLKLLEEPPLKSIFVFCTTDPQKIPNTILSRVQRYDFSRISRQGIVNCLQYICISEVNDENGGIMCHYSTDALDYIAKLANGGMRDAITMMDKCLSYSTELTVESVITALGLSNNMTLGELTTAYLQKDAVKVVDILESVYQSGHDVKQFIKQWMDYVVDLNKYALTLSMHSTSLPSTEEKTLKNILDNTTGSCVDMLNTLLTINSDIKWETKPLAYIEATLIVRCKSC